MHTLDLNTLKRSWQSWLAADLRRAGPYWLQGVWTLVFCLALAALFTLMGFLAFARSLSDWIDWASWRYWYGQNLINCLIVGFLIHGLFEFTGRVLLGRERLQGLTGWRRTAYFAGIPMAGVALGWPLALVLSDGRIARMFIGPQGLANLLASLVLSAVISLVLHVIFSAKTRQIEAERQATQAQLSLLQAQMEPHFLFNTLATIQSHMDHQPDRARLMLAGFTEYLRASLGQLRRSDSTLGQELTLVKHYLALVQQRMEDRLTWQVQADPALDSLPMPAWLIQPLVENAIHHGLEPRIEGGTVRVRALHDGQRLRIQVDDDGQGLTVPSRRGGAGIAIANIQERLATRYGDEGHLAITPLPSGTRAELTLPCLPHPPLP